MRPPRRRRVRLPLRQHPPPADHRLSTSAKHRAATTAITTCSPPKPGFAVSSRIAQGQLPQESWFALAACWSAPAANPVLISWSGSMFEYLMPLLVMPTYENTLLDQTYQAAVDRQIDYGKKRGVPWGISECGYNTIDAHLNYQYRAFGVPGLGFKRGLADDLVIAPYASAMALMVAPGRGLPESRAPQRRRASRRHATDSTKRSTTPPSRVPARAELRRRPLLHGPSPGHEPAVLRLRSAGPPHAKTLRGGPAIPGHHPALAGTHPPRHRPLFASRRSFQTCAPAPPRRRHALPRLHRSQLQRRPKCSCSPTADITSW